MKHPGRAFKTATQVQHARAVPAVFTYKMHWRMNIQYAESVRSYTSYEMVLLPIIFPIPVPVSAWGRLRDKITLARNAFDSLTIKPSHTQRGWVYFNFDDASFPDGLYLELACSSYLKTRQEQLPRRDPAMPGSPVSYFPDGNSFGDDQQTIKIRVPY